MARMVETMRGSVAETNRMRGIRRLLASKAFEPKYCVNAPIPWLQDRVMMAS
jgi:hypothetical protein